MKKLLIIITILMTSTLLLSGCTKGNNNGENNKQNVDLGNLDDLSTYFDGLFKGDWNKPGLYNKDGSSFKMPDEINNSSGTVHDVEFYGAQPNNPEFDNCLIFKQVIAAAQEGDVISIPEGTFYFSSYASVAGYLAHININKSNIELRGAGEGKTILMSNFTEDQNMSKSTTCIAVSKKNNIKISNLTVSSPTDDSVLPDPNDSGLISQIYTGPKYGITIDSGAISDAAVRTSNVVISDVTVEKFQRMGVRIARSSEVTVKDSTFQKALCLGGGGHGYGVNIQGYGAGVDCTDTAVDTIHNVIEGNNFVGPYLRHGALIQYSAHNNLIKDNTFTDTLLDSIDMHGEDEYSNEITGNTINNCRSGAAMAVGNSGATHDKSGRNNYFHGNTVNGGKRAFDAMLGTEYTIFSDNTVKNTEKGVTCTQSNNTYIINNQFEGIKETAISVSYCFDAVNPQVGIPTGYVIAKNKIKNSENGIYVDSKGDDFDIIDNTFESISGKDIEDLSDTFVLPEKSSLMDPVEGTEVVATQSQFVSKEHIDAPGNVKNMKLKASSEEPLFNRAIYALFDVSNVGTYDKVYLCITAKAQVGMPTINIYSNTTYTDWVDTAGSENSLTWNNAPLHDRVFAKINNDNPDHPVQKFVDFKFPVPSYNMITYYIDVTEGYEKIEGDLFTLVFTNDNVESSYMEIYSRLQTSTKQHMRLIFTE